jgi:hypothetical protein
MYRDPTVTAQHPHRELFALARCGLKLAKQYLPPRRANKALPQWPDPLLTCRDGLTLSVHSSQCRAMPVAEEARA